MLYKNKKKSTTATNSHAPKRLVFAGISTTLYSIVRIESNYALNIKKLGACRDEV